MCTRSKTLEEFELRVIEIKKILERIDFPRFKLILNPIKVLFNIKTELATTDSEQSHSLIKGIELKPGQC